MKYRFESANDPKATTTDADSQAPSQPTEEVLVLQGPDCTLYWYAEFAIDKGYPAHHLLADHREDEYLPWWLEAMSKCGTCSTCKLLGPNPLRSHMEDLVEAMEADPEGMATLMANQPALPELPADFASPRMPWDTLH